MGGSRRTPFVLKCKRVVRIVAYRVIRHSFAPLQCGEELQQSICGTIASWFDLEWSGLCQRGFLQGEVRMKVDLRGVDGLVSEPQRNNRRVDIRREQFHRRAMAKDMWRDALGFERWAVSRGGAHVLLDKVLHAVGTQACAVSVRKQDLSARRGGLLEPRLQQRCRHARERRTALLATLALAPDMCARAEGNGGAAEAGQLRQAQSRSNMGSPSRILKVGLGMPRLPTGFVRLKKCLGVVPQGGAYLEHRPKLRTDRLRHPTALVGHLGDLVDVPAD